MSDKEISKDGSGCADEELVYRDVDPKNRSQYARQIKKAKQVVLYPVRKIYKFYRKNIPSSSPGKGGCGLCFMPTLTNGSSVNSHPSDPSSPEFSYEYLKDLIENNDFYSRECNVHIDDS